MKAKDLEGAEEQFDNGERKLILNEDRDVFGITIISIKREQDHE